MKPVKIVNRLAVAGHSRAHIAAFGFANRAAHRACEAIGQFFNVAAQIKRVPVKIRRPVRTEFEGFAPRISRYFQRRSCVKRRSRSLTKPTIS